MAIKKDGEWKTRREEIKQVFVDEFQQLNTLLSIPSNIEGLGKVLVTGNDNDELMKVPFMNKIKEVVWHLQCLNSPVPDDFSGIFYRSY